MKRGEPLRRSTELRADPATVRAWEQRSRRRLPRRSAKRQAEDARTAELRDLVASWPCLLRGGRGDTRRVPRDVPGPCAGPGTPHHLLKASAGGKTSADNLVPLCAAHNTWVEDHPEAARLLGLVVRPGRIDHAEALRRRIAAGLY